MAEALPFTIFLASPSGLEAERELARACVLRFNATEPKPPVSFAVAGWEQVRGTARRPQEAINELIGESHFLIALFRDRWGSEPGSPWGYTSGTEEELFTALLDLGQGDRPMRDVWVVFIEHDVPSPMVVNLRNRMAESHAMLYESVADEGDLEQKLMERLRSWVPMVGGKVAKHVDILPSSGKNVLQVARLRLDGQKLVELGQPEAGLANLRDAALMGGPVELLAYSQQQARSGDVDGAIASAQKAIDYFTSGKDSLQTPLAAEAFAAQAGLYRRQGRDREALGRLEQALTLASGQGVAASRVRCRILDELGLAHQKLKDLDASRACFEASLAERTTAGLGVDQAQSHINLARLGIANGDIPVALKHSETARALLHGLPPSALYANAEALCAQLKLVTGQHGAGVAHAERALFTNRQIANLRGEAISLLLLARCRHGAGDDAAARRDALACLDVNKKIGDEGGIAQATEFLGRLEV